MTDLVGLHSPAIGTSSDDFIVPCGAAEPRPAPAPDGAGPAPAFAVALSGGGFRATLCAMGTLRFLADAGLLGRLRHASSVSGGSVANAVFACAYDDIAAAGFTGPAFDQHALAPLVERVSGRSLKWKLLRNSWRILGRTTRTDVLADAFDDWWLHGRMLSDLPAGVRWIINAANISTGVRFGFERDRIGDYVLGYVPTATRPTRLAEAVAASAAVPGAFAPVLVEAPYPCGRGREARLLDGGAYDNSGLQPLDAVRDACIVAVNAGGTFRVGNLGRVPVVRDLQRANALLYRQSTALRRRFMVERFQAWEQAHKEGREAPPFARRGVLFGLATAMSVTDEWRAGREEHGEWRADLATVDTSFDRFDPRLCGRLIHRGWWLAGATLSRFHRELLPAELPAWRDVEGAPL